MLSICLRITLCVILVDAGFMIGDSVGFSGIVLVLFVEHMPFLTLCMCPRVTAFCLGKCLCTRT